MKSRAFPMMALRNLFVFVCVLVGSTVGQGLYGKGSSVLELTESSYHKNIVKSNYTSIVEFYAPWCGHCKNLKPQYEKAATSLQGLAKVAAVNCDEDVNKQFCGKMGIQGFPTLKIVKPSKKAGSKPVVEDYNGERTAKAIARAVKDKMPNRVARLKDDKFQEWLAKDTNKAKAIFFSDKSLVPSLVKALAIEFRDGIDIGFARPADKSVTEHFRIDSTPSLILIEKKDEEPVRFTGSFDKAEIVEFLSRAAQPQLEVFASKENKKSKKKTSSSRSKQQHEDL